MRTLIIGAGVIGAAVAEELASRGAAVTVLDMRSAGRGATQASAGLLVPYIEGQSQPALLELCARSLGLYDQFIDRIRQRSGLPIEYQREGTVEVALNQEEADRLAALSQWLNEQQIASDWLDATRMRGFEPAVTADALGGLLIPIQGLVAATPLVRALVQAARFEGATFESPIQAVRIETARDGIEVHADARRFAAEAVVVAAGAWSGRVRIAGHPALAVRPIRGQLVQLTWPDATLPRRPIWGSRVYTVPWPPRTLLVGATVEDVGFDEDSTVAGVHDLLAGVGELLPGAWQSSVAEIRVGLRPATESGLPLIGPLPSDPRICLATGHYRNGVLLAPLTAKLVADHVMSLA
jgi:glycine oxidase